jgi:hypothetical protein
MNLRGKSVLDPGMIMSLNPLFEISIDSILEVMLLQKAPENWLLLRFLHIK